MYKHEENTKVKTEPQFQPVDNEDQIQKETFSDVLANEMLLEAQELIKNSDLLTNITETDMENDYDFLAVPSKSEDVDSITNLQFTSKELSVDFDAIQGGYLSESSAQTSVIQRIESTNLETKVYKIV